VIEHTHNALVISPLVPDLLLTDGMRGTMWTQSTVTAVIHTLQSSPPGLPLQMSKECLKHEVTFTAHLTAIMLCISECSVGNNVGHCRINGYHYQNYNPNKSSRLQFNKIIICAARFRVFMLFHSSLHLLWVWVADNVHFGNASCSKLFLKIFRQIKTWWFNISKWRFSCFAVVF